MCVFALIYNKCGEYRFLCVHLYFFSKMVFLLFCCSKTVRCLCECVILWDLGTEFSTCGFSFESTPSTIQTCEKIVLPFSGGTFSNVVTSAYEWVKNHQLPLSGLIVTTPRFVFVWFVEFKFMQIRRWNANTLTQLQLVSNVMFTRIRKIRTYLSTVKVIQVSLAHQCDCLTAFCSSFQVLGRLKRNFESSLICFLCFFFCFPLFYLFSSTKTRRYFDNSTEQKHAKRSSTIT